MKQVEIDRESGFCAGVIRAIGKAEKFLGGEGRRLYSLGAIVHNEAELERLSGKGLVTIEQDGLDCIPGGESVLIRAHGQAPKVYDRMTELGLNVIDCTCPVVLKIQKSIKQAYERLHSGGRDGQLVIFGKLGHAEVLGLVGQVDGQALVVENGEQLLKFISDGKLDTARDIDIFSQTTMSPLGYQEVCDKLASLMSGGARLTVHNTICTQVASRHEKLRQFASTHDIIIFVSGKTSSNGMVLCALCKESNERTYHISSVSELRAEWFHPDDSVGICGATSTPKWLLEQVAGAVLNLPA